MRKSLLCISVMAYESTSTFIYLLDMQIATVLGPIRYSSIARKYYTPPFQKTCLIAFYLLMILSALFIILILVFPITLSFVNDPNDTNITITITA